MPLCCALLHSLAEYKEAHDGYGNADGKREPPWQPEAYGHKSHNEGHKPGKESVRELGADVIYVVATRGH